MALIDLIFASSRKIYSAQIEEIPAGVFSRQVKLTINGQSGVYCEMGLKKILMDLTRGGITLSGLEERLKALGANNDQIGLRKEIIGILKEKCLGNK